MKIIVLFLCILLVTGCNEKETCGICWVRRDRRADRRVLCDVFGAGQRGKCWSGVFHVRREGYHPFRRLALAFSL